MVTIKDLAKKSGYSSSTVSKVLNGYKEIGEDAKREILKVADELGYKPNYHARALKTNRTYNIGIVYHDHADSGLKNAFFAWIIDGIRLEAEKMGYDLTFLNGNIGDEKTTYLQHALYRGFDGVCVICTDTNHPSFHELVHNKHFPVVTIDIPEENVTSVFSNNYQGIVTLMNHILDNGHKKIAYVHGNEGLFVTNDRLRAYKDTLTKNSIDINNQYIISSEYRNTSLTEQAIRTLLDLENPPTCIMLSDDFAALGAFNVLRERGLTCPDDISLAGYDGIQTIRYMSPRLTSIEQNCDLIGKTAFRKLFSLIENPEHSIASNVYVDGQLIVGESIKKM